MLNEGSSLYQKQLAKSRCFFLVLLPLLPKKIPPKKHTQSSLPLLPLYQPQRRRGDRQTRRPKNMTTSPEAATDFELVRVRVRAEEHNTKKRKKGDEPPSGRRSDTRSNYAKKHHRNNNDDDNNEEEVEDNSDDTLAPDVGSVMFTLPRHGRACTSSMPLHPELESAWFQSLLSTSNLSYRYCTARCAWAARRP